jgi:hypothetical protein
MWRPISMLIILPVVPMVFCRPKVLLIVNIQGQRRSIWLQCAHHERDWDKKLSQLRGHCIRAFFPSTVLCLRLVLFIVDAGRRSRKLRSSTWSRRSILPNLGPVLPNCCPMLPLLRHTAYFKVVIIFCRHNASPRSSAGMFSAPADRQVHQLGLLQFISISLIFRLLASN